MKRFIPFFFMLPAFLFFSKKDGQFDKHPDNRGGQYIDWSMDKKLDWDDFQADPVTDTDAAALTATHLGFSYSYQNGRVVYNISCRFDRTKSWGLVKNEWILQHEQGHFDITEIFARKLNQAVSEYKFNRRTFQRDLDQIYRKLMAEKEAYQEEYDSGSDFSRHKRSQKDWLKKIEKDLEETQQWANYR